MKKIVRKVGITLTALCLTLTIAAQDRPVSYEQLPKPARDFITTHFPSVKVAYAEVDWDGYDVVLANGTDLEFTLKGQWTEIQVRRTKLPESIMKLLPATLTNYLKKHYLGKTIKEINNKPYGYELELVGLHDLELLFDKTGKFLRIDD